MYQISCYPFCYLILNNLIKNAAIDKVTIGVDISILSIDLDEVTQQEIDIPSIQGFYIDGKYIELFVLDNKVIEIRFDLEYEENNSNLVHFRDNSYWISNHSTFDEILSVLKNENISIANIVREVNNHQIELENGVLFLFGHDKKNMFLQRVSAR